jgi:hypothetical protein
MGFDLERIGDILGAEDRLAELRDEVARGISRRRHQEVIREAIALNGRMQHQVREKLAQLEDFVTELESKARRYREIAREQGVELDADDELAPSPR